MLLCVSRGRVTFLVSFTEGEELVRQVEGDLQTRLTKLIAD